MFWQDLPIIRERGQRVLGPMPLIPRTGWSAPKTFPNLKNASIIGLDVETYDPDLLTKGPGWARFQRSGDKQEGSVPYYLHPEGSLVGVSLAVSDQAWYFPIRHTIQPETNLDPDKVLRWLRDTLAGAQPKIGTNLIYDIGWLQEEGVIVNGPLLDISYAEALLSETAKVGLDTLAKKYIGTGKESNLLYRWCADWYGGAETDQRKNIWRAPPCLVGPYAEADAALPLRIFEQQKRLLSEQGLLNLFDMECRLSRLLLAMRFRGVRVDVEQAQRVDDALTLRINKIQSHLNTLAHTDVNVNAAASIAVAFDEVGLKYPLTAKSKQPSFTRSFLKSVDHPIANKICDLRRCQKLRDTFVRSYILESHVNGRVHTQFHPMRSDGYGTRSGRFSSSNPNLQNIPSRDVELAPLVRSIFIPEEGAAWHRYDYSQIEYRLLVHFAVGQGAELARELYRNDPTTDYHAAVQKRLKEEVNRDIARIPTKNINFGLVYGMGEPLLAEILQITRAEAKKLFADYHAAVPYVRATMDAIINRAQQQGYIETILGRRSRFELWEPTAYGKNYAPLVFNQAVVTYGGNIQRAGLHKALNRLLQGSAADLIKMAMLRCWEDGLFAGDQAPLLTVHDELDFSVANPNSPVWQEIKNIMEQVLPLKVPVIVDVETGPNWGTLKKLVV